MKPTSLFSVALAVASVTGLAGCESEVEPDRFSYAPESPESIAFADELTPAPVVDAIRNLRSVDGNIAQASFGKFDIQESTHICSLGRGFSIDFDGRRDLFAALGQSRSHPSGSGRSSPFESYHGCKEDEALITRSFQSDSAQLGYEMTLAVWQNEGAFWVGTIARPDRIHPTVKDWPPPAEGSPPGAVVGGSMQLDLRELSEGFVEHIIGDHDQ